MVINRLLCPSEGKTCQELYVVDNRPSRIEPLLLCPHLFGWTIQTWEKEKRPPNWTPLLHHKFWLFNSYMGKKCGCLGSPLHWMRSTPDHFISFSILSFLSFFILTNHMHVNDNLGHGRVDGQKQTLPKTAQMCQWIYRGGSYLFSLVVDALTPLEWEVRKERTITS